MAESMTIEIFLPSSDLDQIRVITQSNWNGIIFLAKKEKISELLPFDHIGKPGIYLLANADYEKVYVGESDNLIERLKTQQSKGEHPHWDNTIILTCTDDQLTKTQVQYLEAVVIDKLGKLKGISLTNNTKPSPTIPHKVKSTTDVFFNRFEFILKLMGMRLFEKETPQLIKPSTAEETSPEFIMTSNGIDARAKLIGTDFVVLEGSTIRKLETNSLATSYRIQRQRYLEDGIFRDSSDPEYWVLTQDVYFSSPSAAANTLAGASRNGYTAWKLQNSDQDFGQWYQMKNT